MRKIILAIMVILAGITLSNAESCSVSNGTLSYQISGCSEQKRACCSGQWCSWGTASCASCTATSESAACSNVSSIYSSGTATRSRTVTGTCGSCSYSDWSGWNTSNCVARCQMRVSTSRVDIKNYRYDDDFDYCNDNYDILVNTYKSQGVYVVLGACDPGISLAGKFAVSECGYTIASSGGVITYEGWQINVFKKLSCVCN